MKLYKLLWDTHKWTGITLSVFLLISAGTGFLLLLKKRYQWIQPPTRKGTAGGVDEFITLQELFHIVLGQGHEDFRTLEDIGRIDYRPKYRVHKIHSNHHHSEIQVDAVTGEILSVDVRVSDLIENIHDGTFFADWVHDWFMPLVPIGLTFLVGSGLYLWLAPMIRKRLQRRRVQQTGP